MNIVPPLAVLLALVQFSAMTASVATAQPRHRRSTDPRPQMPREAEFRSIDGSGNNVADATLGAAATPLRRRDAAAPARVCRLRRRHQ